MYEFFLRRVRRRIFAAAGPAQNLGWMNMTRLRQAGFL